jgi:hypothetical protein
MARQNSLPFGRRPAGLLPACLSCLEIATRSQLVTLKSEEEEETSGGHRNAESSRNARAKAPCQKDKLCGDQIINPCTDPNLQHDKLH